MNRGKKGLAILLLMAIAIGGCSPAPTAGENGRKETEAAGPGTENAETGKIYAAKVHEIPLEKVKSLFLGEREIETEYRYESQFYEGKFAEGSLCADGTSLSLECGVLSFITVEGNNYPEHYFLDETTAKSVFPDGITAEFPDRDLPMMSTDDAKTLVKKYLDAMGVEYAENWTVYSVTGEGLTAAEQRYYPDEEYEADVAFGYKPVKRIFGQEDDVYIMRIPLALEGHELSQEGIYGENQSYQLPASWANVIVGKDGLLMMEMWHPFDVTGVIGEGAMITEEEALEAAKEYCSHLVGMGEITFSGEGLYYVPRVKTVMTADAFEVRPMWMFGVYNGERELQKLFVDAISGKVE